MRCSHCLQKWKMSMDGLPSINLNGALHMGIEAQKVMGKLCLAPGTISAPILNCCIFQDLTDITLKSTARMH